MPNQKTPDLWDIYGRDEKAENGGLHFWADMDISREKDELHIHPYIQIWYVKSGSYKHFFKGTEFTLGKGAMVIVPSNFPHYIDTRSQSELIRCEFTDDFICDIRDKELADTLFNLIYLEPVLVNTNKIEPYHYFSETAAEELEEIFDILCREHKKKDAFSALFVRANLIKLLALIAREYSIYNHDEKLRDYRDAINQAFLHIEQHYNEKLYLQDVCRIAKMCKSSFGYLFKQIMGMPFAKYVQYLRVFHAKELLCGTDRTQEDIASACGFASVSFFHRVFKQFTGVLPGQYRKQNAMSDLEKTDAN